MRKDLIIAGICILLMISAGAERVIDVSLMLYEDDTVEGNYVIITEGRATDYHREEGDYELRALDSDGNSVWSQRLEIIFGYKGPPIDGVPYPSGGDGPEAYSLSFRIPYQENMTRLVLLHGTETVFSKDIYECNNNGICDNIETYYSCPVDCSPGSRDKVCINYADGLCDPDCARGVDPDCEPATTTTRATTLPTTVPTTTTIEPEGGQDIIGYLPYFIGAIVLVIIAAVVLRSNRMGRMKQKKKKDEEDLREWVEEQLRSGEDPELLRRALKKQGASPAMVDGIMDRL